VAEAPPARGRRQLRDLVVLGYSHAGQHAYTAGLGIAIPFAVAAFHTSYAVVGVLLSVAAIAGSALQGLSVVVRRTSARVLFVVQNVGSALGAVIAALSPTIYLFMFGRFVQSASGWPQHPVGASYLSRRYPEARGKVLSWHVTAGNVGTLVAPLVVPAVIAAEGFRAAFWLLALLLATTAIVVALWLPVSWRPLQAAPARTEGEPGFWRQLHQLMRQRPVFALLLAGTIAAGGQGIGIVGVYAPSYLHSGLHESAFWLGAILFVLYVGAVIGPVLMGRIADRRNHRTTLLANYLLGAAMLVLFAEVGSARLGLVAAGLGIGIFSYSELSLRQTVFSDYLPEGLSRAGFGVFFTVSQSIGAIWIAVLGVTITDVGFVAAFLVMAGTFLVAALVVWWGTRSPVSVD